MKSFLKALPFVMFGGILGNSIAYAAMTKAEYDATLHQAKDQYTSSKKECKHLSGNKEDICIATAKLEREKMESQAEANYKGTAKAHREAALRVAKAEYKLAEEKCDDLAGNAKDVCEAKAKADLTKAETDIKTDKKINKNLSDAAEEKNEANYKVAAEQCDAYSGAAKDTCINSAKSLYHQ